MLIKLVQTTMLDVATSVDGLDFSRLNGRDDWELTTAYRGAPDCLACVKWQPAARYFMQTGQTTVPVARHDLIIPTLVGELKRLCDLPGPQPTIYVSPWENA